MWIKNLKTGLLFDVEDKEQIARMLAEKTLDREPVYSEAEAPKVKKTKAKAEVEADAATDAKTE